MADVNPLLPNSDNDGENTANKPAVELIRAKLDRLYSGEPDAKKELAEAQAEPERELSKHQKFMLELKSSGKSIAQIQTEWHEYYNGLLDEEKRAVWQEFYDHQSGTKFGNFYEAPAATNGEEKQIGGTPNTEALKDFENQVIISEHLKLLPPRTPRRRRPAAKPRIESAKKAAQKIHESVRKTTANRADYERKQLRAKHNLQSLAFGLAVGLVVILVFMFSFFNERFIAPFIHPGVASATPIIIDPTAVSPTSQPEIIIPKIDVQIPLVFNVNTTDESKIEDGLEDGVVHYPTTVLPGQKGNSAYFGHSSNNIFSPGKYKFAFVQLRDLKKGDLFYITYDKKIYVYKVYDRQIVDPTDVAVLDDVPGKAATTTLITCDPPGTSLNRLVVWGEQISPSPTKNGSNSQPRSTEQPSQIVGNGPSLWDRIWPF